MHRRSRGVFSAIIPALLGLILAGCSGGGGGGDNGPPSIGLSFTSGTLNVTEGSAIAIPVELELAGAGAIDIARFGLGRRMLLAERDDLGERSFGRLAARVFEAGVFSGVIVAALAGDAGEQTVDQRRGLVGVEGAEHGGGALGLGLAGRPSSCERLVELELARERGLPLGRARVELGGLSLAHEASELGRELVGGVAGG